MFRVETDLATKTSYVEVSFLKFQTVLSNNVTFLHSFYKWTPSPALYSLPGTAVLTAVSTPMSSASMYSQDSWKTTSPSVSAVEDEVDSRRTTIATIPTVQWSVKAEEDGEKGFTSKSPSVLSVSTPSQDVSFSMVKVDNDTVSHSKSDVEPSLANNPARESIKSLIDVGSSRSLGKRLSKIMSQSKKIDQHKPKHSRSSKAIRKVMNRLSFLPSKRELAQL